MGKDWTVPIRFFPRADLWAVADFGAVVADEVRALGRLEFDVSRLSAPDSSHRVFASGPLRFGGSDDVADGMQSGYLCVDAHPVDETTPLGEITVHGMVEAVDLVPIRFERRDRMFEPTEVLAPRRVHSTLDRVDFEAHEMGGDEQVHCDLLVWLDVHAVPS